jgi:hypothetical protein
MRLLAIVSAIALSLASSASAQTGTALLIEVRAGEAVIADAEVTVAGTTVKTGANGAVRVAVTPGPVDVLGAEVERFGHILSGCPACEYRVRFSRAAEESS